jgi:hypothetical protein
MALLDWLKPARKETARKSFPCERFRALPNSRAIPIPTRPRTEGFNNLVPLGGTLYGGFIESKDVSPERWHPFSGIATAFLMCGRGVLGALCSTKRTRVRRRSQRRGGAMVRRAARVDRFNRLRSPTAEGSSNSFFNRAPSAPTPGNSWRPRTARIERFYPVDPATIRFKRFHHRKSLLIARKRTMLR